MSDTPKSSGGNQGMSASEQGDKGFTLIEMAIAIAISTFVMAGLYGLHRSMVRSNQTVEQTAGTQQNIRAGLHHMVHELRLAGADPEGGAYNSTTALPFKTHLAGTIRVTMDINNTAGVGVGDGTLSYQGEDVGYMLRDRDGNTATGPDTDLIRVDFIGNSTVVIAENIDALNFYYLDEDGNQALTVDEIRAVQVTMVARANIPPRFSAVVDDTIYTNMQNEVIYTPRANDRYRRLRLATEVVCRNMGL